MSPRVFEYPKKSPKMLQKRSLKFSENVNRNDTSRPLIQILGNQDLEQ